MVSKKTQTFTRVKLPEYAIDIIRRNNRRGSFILPRLANVNLNKYIKELGELAGWTHTYEKLREIQGRPVTVYKNAKKREHYRFCDLITTHTMRRTTITTMLHLGMDESSVRRISGHAPGSQEFYKYVKYSQSLLDEKTDEVFQKLQQKLSKIA